MMSTMHPGGSSRRLLRESEQREREDGKEPPVYARTDYTFIEAPCFGSEDHTPQSAALRRQQRERFHSLNAEDRSEYLRDLTYRNTENAAVAAIIEQSPPQERLVERWEVDALVGPPPQPRPVGPVTRVFPIGGRYVSLEVLCEMAGVNRTTMIGRLRGLGLSPDAAVAKGPKKGTAPVATTAAPDVEPEVEPEVEPGVDLEDDDEDYAYALPRSRKGKQQVRFRG
jgi:hypothetical protein